MRRKTTILTLLILMTIVPVSGYDLYETLTETNDYTTAAGTEEEPIFIDESINFDREPQADVWFEFYSTSISTYLVSISNFSGNVEVYIYGKNGELLAEWYQQDSDWNYTVTDTLTTPDYHTKIYMDVYQMGASGTITIYNITNPLDGSTQEYSRSLKAGDNKGNINESLFYYHFYPHNEVEILHLNISDGYSFSIFDGTDYLYENKTELSIVGDQLTEEKYWVIINGSDGEFILNSAYSTLPGYSLEKAEIIDNTGLFGMGKLYMDGAIPDDEISYYYNITIYQGGTYKFSIFPDGDGDDSILNPSIYVDGVSVGNHSTQSGYPKSVEYSAEKTGVATLRVYCSYYSDTGHFGYYDAELEYNTKYLKGFDKLSHEGYDIYAIDAGEVNFNITYYGLSHHVFIVDTLEGTLVENALINYYESLDKTHIIYSSLGNAEISKDLFTTIKFNYTITENTWLVIASGNVVTKLPGIVGGYTLNSTTDNTLITDATDDRLYEQTKSISDNLDGVWDDTEWMAGVFQDLQPDDLIDLIIYGSKDSFVEDVGLLLMYGDTLENLTRAINSVNAFYASGTELDDNILLFALLDYESINIVQLRYNGTNNLNIVLFSNFEVAHSNFDIIIRSSHQITFIDNTASVAETVEEAGNFILGILSTSMVVLVLIRKRRK